MVATGPHDQENCPAVLYRREFTAQTSNFDEDSDQTCLGIAFAELVSDIDSFDDDTTTTTGAPVFHVANLCQQRQYPVEAHGSKSPWPTRYG